jgi:hypothetical protein
MRNIVLRTSAAKDSYWAPRRVWVICIYTWMDGDGGDGEFSFTSLADSESMSFDLFKGRTSKLST